MLDSTNLYTERNDALRLRYTKVEIGEAIAKNLHLVREHRVVVEERLKKALASANCDASQETLTELAEQIESRGMDLGALDATACEILNTVRLLQPLEALEQFLELISTRHDFAPSAATPGGTHVLLTGGDYSTLIAPFDAKRFERRLFGPIFRPMQRMGISTALGRGYGPQPLGGFGEAPGPSSINELLSPKGGSDAA